jgi:uncharacterized protein YnzC (UPF0291/DUF896 family)
MTTSLVNFSLNDILKIDKYRFCLLKNLGKLVLEEYDLQNYESCVKTALVYLKLYRRLVREFSNTTLVDTRVEDDIQPHNMKDVKYMSPKYLDRVISAYMECRKYLVSPTVHKLIQEQINPFLPRHEQWETFMSYKSMTDVDGIHESEYQLSLKSRCNKYATKLVEHLKYLQKFKKATIYEQLLFRL